MSVDLEDTMMLIIVSRKERIGLSIKATISHSTVGRGA